MNSRQRDILHAYSVTARPILITFAGRNSCIAATRVTIDCLQRYGINLTPHPVKFALEVPSRNIAYTSGLSEGELATAGKVPTTPYGQGWRGHLIARGSDCLVDASLDQADAPLRGVLGLQDQVFVWPVTGTITDQFTAEYALEAYNGVRAKLTYVSIDDHSYLESEAWNDEGLPLLVDLIYSRTEDALRRMRKKTKRCINV